MFIIDLILVTVWAIFFSQSCSPGLLLLIPVRIALCFEMQKASKWTLVSALAFLAAYSFINNFERPFERMFINFFCTIGESESMVDLFSKPLEGGIRTCLGVISATWYAWLAVMPVVIGIAQRRIQTVCWKKKGIWIYMVPVTALCVWLIWDDGEVGAILWGLFTSLLPLLYWTLYERRGRSLAQLIIEDTQIRWYLAYAVYMLAVVTIGLRDIYSLKLIGLLVLPPLFYIMLVKLTHIGIVLTRCCAALSVSGLFYWLSFDVGQTATIVLLSIAIALIVYVGITMIIRSHKWVVPTIIIVAIPFAIAPGILGMNPYVIPESEHTHLYVTNLSVRNGVYVVEKYIESNTEGQPYRYKRFQGLRDRYGLILPIQYDELKPLDKRGRYLAVGSSEKTGNHTCDQKYGVFDLRKRKFILNPADVEISKIEMIDEGTFKLIGSEGRYFATLYMPGEHNGRYYYDAHIEPHFADGETSVEEFLARAKNPDLDTDNQLWEVMRRKNPHAFRIVVHMFEIADEECSPINDLNYARAIREIVRKDKYYKGDINKALSDIENLSGILTDSGSQLDINTWTEYLRLISSIRTSLAYDLLISSNQDNEWIRKEYVAWHNLTEAMVYYLDHLYSYKTYRAVPEEKNNQIIRWLDFKRNAVGIDQDIISNTSDFETTKAYLVRDPEEYENFFKNFRNSSNEYFYHPMWNEIKYAFDEWRCAREKVAESLDAHQRVKYEEFSRDLAASLFLFISELDWPEFQSARESVH